MSGKAYDLHNARMSDLYVLNRPLVEVASVLADDCRDKYAAALAKHTALVRTYLIAPLDPGRLGMHAAALLLRAGLCCLLANIIAGREDVSLHWAVAGTRRASYRGRAGS